MVPLVVLLYVIVMSYSFFGVYLLFHVGLLHNHIYRRHSFEYVICTFISHVYTKESFPLHVLNFCIIN